MYKGYSDDITWCSNRDCTRKKCKRNPMNIRKDAPPTKMFSFADFEGTQYCIKENQYDKNGND